MTGLGHFEALYRHDADPWRSTSWYERRKREVLLASLLQPRYDVAWDPACGTGVLAGALAQRCTRVLASDASPRAVELTTERVVTRGLVEAHRHTLPHEPCWLSAPVDLVVLAEILYYLPATERELTYSLADRVASRQRAEVVSVHWRHDLDDAYAGGEAVTGELDAALTGSGWSRTVRHDEPDFVLAGWARLRPAPHSERLDR